MSFDYNSPIITRRRLGNTDDPFISISESHQIINSKVVLTEIPDRFTKVQVTGENITWLERTEGIPGVNEYVVDYNSNIVTFNSSRNGLQLLFTYKGTGLHYVPANMIYTQTNNGEIAETLKTLTDETAIARDTANQTNTDIQLAEDTRVTNENTRVTNEATREINETTRQTNESTREINESNRVNAEATRSTNEDTRQTNESTRETNESARVAAETNRANAESTRETNENIRVTNETNRTNAETTRETNETTRQNNETTRQTQESQRQTNTNNAITRLDTAVNTTKMEYLSPVSTYSNISTTYPTPKIGYTVQVMDTNDWFRYDGTSWRLIQNLNLSGYATSSSLTTLENKIKTAEFSSKLTNDSQILSLGVGKDSTNATVDVSSSVVNGQVSVSLRGVTRTNLVPLFDSGKWALHTNVTVNSPTKITLNATDNYQNSIYKVNNIYENTIYSWRIQHNARIIIDYLDLAGVKISSAVSYSTATTGTFTTPIGTKMIQITLTNSTLGAGAFTFEYIQLEQTDIVKPYITGTKSTLSERLTSIGKNFNSSILELGSINAIGDNFNDTANPDRVRSKDYIFVPNNTQLTINTDKPSNVSIAVYEYDKDKKFILRTISASTTTTLTTSSNTKFIRLLFQNDTTRKVQIEKGTTATTREDFKESISYVTLPQGEVLRSVGSVKDEVNATTGELIKRIKPYTLQATDFATLNTTLFTNLDIVVTNVFTDNKTWSNAIDNSIVAYDKNGNVLTQIAYDEATMNVSTNANKYYTGGNQRLGFLVPKGTYATLTDAQNTLAGTSLTYQLANPLVTDIEGMTPLQSFEKGTMIVEPYLKKAYTITGTTITLDYPILAIDKLQQLVANEWVDVTGTLSTDGKTITVTELGTYNVEGVVRPEESTIPTIEHSVPLNRSAQTDSNTVMIRQLAEQQLALMAEIDALKG